MRDFERVAVVSYVLDQLESAPPMPEDNPAPYEVPKQPKDPSRIPNAHHTEFILVKKDPEEQLAYGVEVGLKNEFERAVLESKRKDDGEYSYY